MLPGSRPRVSNVGRAWNAVGMSLLDQEVRRSWDRIRVWLGSHTQEERQLRLAADKACVDAVERELGTALPVDLVALWQLERVDAGYWLPPAGACALEEPMEALSTRAILLRVAEEEDPDDPMWPDRFTPELLPIAMNGGGDSLVVDLRPGEHGGAVFFWDHEEWGLEEPLWPSVAAMLADVAHALESGAPALTWHAARGGGQRPCVPIINGWNEFEGWQTLA